MKGYYFITDAILSRAGNFSDVRNALRAGVRVVQYRNKCGSTKAMHEEALSLRALCKDILFIINDRIDIALSVGADGVHLGQEDLPYASARKLLGKKKIIGMTVHSVAEAKRAQSLGADYIGVSPIFTTQTKNDAGKALGVTIIEKIKKEVQLPLVAVGGIDLINAAFVITAGADSLCAISAVIRKANVKNEIEKFQRLFKNSR
ncbi:MAG: thiamine phosphate synthase [Candidatus Omnitrophota bacterium]